MGLGAHDVIDEVGEGFDTLRGQKLSQALGGELCDLGLDEGRRFLGFAGQSLRLTRELLGGSVLGIGVEELKRIDENVFEPTLEIELRLKRLSQHFGRFAKPAAIGAEPGKGFLDLFTRRFPSFSIGKDGIEIPAVLQRNLVPVLVEEVLVDLSLDSSAPTMGLKNKSAAGAVKSGFSLSALGQGSPEILRVGISCSPSC